MVHRLKCNREQPCQNCITRDHQAGCFIRGVERAPTIGAERGGVRGTGAGLQQRIDRLESLVTALMKDQEQVPALVHGIEIDGHTPPQGSNPILSPINKQGVPLDAMPPVQHGMGVLTMNDTSSVYRGTTHWHDLLKELTDLKSYCGQVQDEDESEEDILQDASTEISSGGPSLFCGIVPQISMHGILASLPPKPACDKLMGRFWNERNSVMPTFREYLEVKA